MMRPVQRNGKHIGVSFIGAFSLLLGVTVLAGWHLHDLRSIYVLPTSPPMAYNTALSFVLCGIGVLAACWDRPRVLLVVSATLCVIGGITLSEYFSGVDLHFDEILMSDYIQPTLTSPRMAFSTAFCFTLISLAFWLLRPSARLRSRLLFVALCGSIVLMLGLVDSFRYSFGLTVPQGGGAEGFLRQMAIHTATGFIFLGLALVVLVWQGHRSVEKSAPSWLPFPIFFAVLAGALALAVVLHEQERLSVHMRLQAELAHITNTIAERLETRVHGLQRMAKSWEIRGGTPYTEWAADAAEFMRSHRGDLALGWADLALQVHWQILKDPASSFSFSLVAEELQRLGAELACVQNTPPRLSRSFPLHQGDQVLLIAQPLAMNDTCGGFVVGAFHVFTLFGALIPAEVKDTVDLTIWDGEHVLYHQGNVAPSAIAEDVKEVFVQLYGTSWRLQVKPTSVLLAQEQSPFPLLVFLNGILVAGLLAAAVALNQKARQRGRQLWVTNQLLSQEIATHQQTAAVLQESMETLRESEERIQAVIKTAIEGIITIDAQGRIESFNPAAAQIFGYRPDEVLGQNVSILMPEPYAAKHDTYIANYLRTGERKVIGTGREVTGRRKDGAVFPMELSLTEVRLGNHRQFAGFVRDISERKAAEAALRQEEERLRKIVATAPGVIYSYRLRPDGTACFPYISPAVQDIYGLRSEELTEDDSAVFNRIHPDDIEHVRATIAESARTLSPWRAEFRLLHPDKGQLWVEGHSIPQREPDGGVRWHGFASDITTRKQMEETQSYLAALVESSEDAIVGATLDGVILSWNRAAEGLYGYTAAEARGKSIFSLIIPPDHVEEGKDILSCIQQGKRVEHLETVRVRKDSRRVEVSISVSSIKDSAGRIIGASASARDITARKRAEAQLAALWRQYEQILTAVTDGIVEVDLQERITFINPAATRLLGCPAAELVDQTLQNAVCRLPQHGEHALCATCPVAATLTQGKTGQGSSQIFWRKDGSSFPVECSSTPIYDDDRMTGMVLTFRDISAQQAVERMKKEFVSVVSHELRTPLTSIHGALGLLASGKLGTLADTGQRMLEIAATNTDRLVRLVNDILDLERMESGKITMHKERCQAEVLFAQAVETMRAMAEKADVTLLCSAHPLELSADPDRLLQVFTNLLSNAIKFSPAHTTVRLSAEQRNGHILFAVSDQGRGIPADKLEAIFERFQQVDSSDAREKGGTGLGLPICRTIVEQHGGRIWVESTPGVGSTFFFTLPALLQTNRLPAKAPEQPVVLVCDDDVATLEVLNTQLRHSGYYPVVVASGQEALATAATQCPDVILLDLCMPEMDGWATLDALQTQPETKDIPVVLLSGLPPGECNRPAVVEWLSKPPDDARLSHSLDHALSVPTRGAKILLVEDDWDHVTLFKFIFERHGIDVLHAGTSEAALVLSRQLTPDVVILDLALPDQDGFTVMESLQQQEHLRQVPICIYSIKDLTAAELERIRGTPTQVYVKGSTTPLELERRVLALLGRRLRQHQTQPGSGSDHELLIAS